MHASNSPPTTPSAASNYKATRRMTQSRPSVRETFLDEYSVGDNTNNGMDSGDERDPHDLSLSPKHAARTSIVDNMLLSLDQFASSNTSVLDDYRLFNSVLESDLYGRCSPDSMTQRRYRGHTFSSSLSSELDYNPDDAAGRYGTQPGRARRSTSSSNYNSNLRRFGSTRTPDGPSSRGQLYDHRSNSGGGTSGVRGTRQGSKGSSSSHMDFGPPLSGNHRADLATERRSASFDFGTRQTIIPFKETAVDYDPVSFDGVDAAPTPSIPGGPRKYQVSSQGEYPGTLGPQPSRTPVASRRNSVKSARTRSTAAMTGRENDVTQLGAPILEPPPAIPAATFDPPAPSPTISFNKPIFPTPSDPAPTRERPGFFRRVFGSSKNSTPGAENNQVDLVVSQDNDLRDLNSSTTNLKDRRQPLKSSTAGTTTVRQGAHQVVNKKSSFFRRRKRSVTENVPPPILIPPESGSKPHEVMKPQPSPVSSLRKVMNPYLADASAPGLFHPTESHSRNIGTDKQENKGVDSPAEKPKESFHAAGRVQRPKYSLYPAASSDARETSSLGSKIGDEDIPKVNDMDSTSSANPEQLVPRDDIGSRDSGPDSESDRAVGVRNRLTPQDLGVPSLSPVVERFSQKSVSPIESPEETRTINPGEPEEVKHQSEPRLYDREDESSPKSPPVDTSGSLKVSTSNISNYYTASNTPVVSPVESKSVEISEGKVDCTDDVLEDQPGESEKEQAQKLYDSQDQVVGNEPAAAWLGDPDRAMTRKAYMEFFDWSNMNILAALRSLCNRLILKGETQQVDRVLDAFSIRWCECNPNHGFKASDVVHTICYSLLLLNTDLHLADIEQKMTKGQFVRNTMPTIHRVAFDAAPDGFEALHVAHDKSKVSARESLTSPMDESDRGNMVADKPANAPAKLVNRLSRTDLSVKMLGDPETNTGPLVNVPFNGTDKAWGQQVETVLRDFYTSIQKQRLPLHGAQAEKEALRTSSNHLLSPNPSGLRRSPSTVSRSGSDIYPRGRSADSRYGTARWSSKNRSRARLYPPSVMGSSRTSLEEQSSFWSPSASSTWSKQSLGKLTSVSVDSFGSDYMRGDYQQSIGFANALSHAIIREDSAYSIASTEEIEGTIPLLEDETLQLAGAPWAKEGSLKHKQHLDSADKRAKDRNWNECFAVIQQGWMRLFSFNSSTKSVRHKPKTHTHGGVVVGGGNWTENAEEVRKFLLRQTLASVLPSPGYSKSRPHVWALSLPNGAVHLFQAGTPEIVHEFVSTANYWSARLSKEPLVGGVSNMEYGWSDTVINSALISAENNSNRSPPSSSGARPSIQSSIRSSIDQQGGVRPRLPADRVHISDWAPPQQSMVASNLPEADQLKALRMYVKNVEDELQRHNELRPAMVLAFSPRHPNATKSMANWERKSSYLLRENVKFRTYIETLQRALDLKNKIYASREESSPSR
ncbi:Sec7 domain protein [Aspergillus parasiticus SU-1]|uniref:Sec7 domain protein n=1 Tax=Aspergillus parasiticus (strain ATCC 56775 / NRRL 5862 / SRRC 143 / SU-1) TaxID=1403190 RepID=A0A0F0IIZ5_ASPPU|nr:Sec7 domain protein [Aspergillus parasiticus SU-1]